jgi:EAL domain-containing protein (putative c-di-GMP-specific phosphodiesterase class I)
VSAASSGGSGFVGHLGDRDFVALIPPAKAIEFSERVIEQFELRLGGVSNSAEEGKTEGVVSLSIAVLTNEVKPFRHIAEVIRTCEQIHRFLKRYQHSAYLKDRRTAVRDLLSPASFDIGGKRPSVSPESGKAAHFNSELLMTVASAIHSGRLESHFQPIVDPRCGVFAYEALSRFPGADGKLIDPIKMFQAAREADLIKELDIACALSAMRCAEKMPPKTKLFLNLNRETLLDPHSLSQLWDSGYFDTRRIVIEITEQSLVRQSSQLRSVMRELNAHGIQLALDDAGGGSVSLREAAELKPEFIKFDKSIIRDIHLIEIKRKILLSLSVFAKSMNSQTVAEGVEIREELDYLQSADINFFQGYFIARPNAVPLAAVHLPR